MRTKNSWRARAAKRIEYCPMYVMSPEHPRWAEFCDYLSGPDFCNFHRTDKSDPDSWKWTCDSNDHSKPFCRTILNAMGGFDVEESLRFFEQHGGFCDCEVLFNVAR